MRNRRMTTRATAALMLGLCLIACESRAAAAAAVEQPATRPITQNVILITVDGYRWQDMFGGYDDTLNSKAAGGVPSALALSKLYKRETPEKSRAVIMPFFWETVATQGQVFGVRSANNVGKVTNPYRFSYPGYSEMLCGYVDPHVNSNRPVPNPNVTVLEWLNKRPGFEGKVAVYGAWDAIKAIVNHQRAGIPAVSGWDPIESSGGVPLTEREKLLNDLLARTLHYWPDEPPDALICEAAMEYLEQHKPRVFYVSLGETDEWAHGRRYDLYLQSAQRSDAFIKRLWEKVQSMPEYAGKTALVITTDHGRGGTPEDWTDHGEKVPGAEGWWAAVLGPDTKALGVRGDGEVTQSQIAATLAGLVGEDYAAAQPKAAKPLNLKRLTEPGSPE